MMNIATLVSNWNFMRILRLGIGIYIAVQAIQNHDIFAGIIASFFILQAITNSGCCGSGGCATNKDSANSSTENIEFEEIKNK